MEDLCGGWLLHKATGGSGRRKLIVIAPEAEGYSVRALRAASAGGKATFYIVPLQETLDTSPLPSDSQHFSKMPRKTCYQCKEAMPLHMLAVHIKTCKGKLSSDETCEESSDELWVVENKCKVVCPICTKEFPDNEITFHASLCGESFECTVTSEANDSGPSTHAQSPVCKPRSTEDVLHFLEHQVDTTTEFKLCVDREDLPDRGILQWKRKKAASPASALKVVYIGEAGIDTGALRKEFLTDMVSGIENRFFEGAGNQGKNPKYSLTDLDNENFRTIGEIMAASLAQGGPPPAFLREWCYNFLCTGEVDLNSLSKEDVADLESCQLISRVDDSADAQCLMLNVDEIISCGYTSQITLECKESIIRAIVLHSTTRLIPMLQQIRKGMELYGLVNQMAANPEACRSLFVPGKIIKPDADFIIMNCQPNFSEKGTSKGRTERKIINFLQDFLQEVEMSDGETDRAAVPHVLQWMTGQSHIPMLPDEKRHFKITCNFDHNCRERLGDHAVCYPIVSACTQTVTFPVQHLSTYTDFRRIMSEAVKYGGGFHRV
uniref:HECT domain-containing protein n=1 Tax=Gasterosteus aculeatus aculeatus TaxID=481459 RepID=G3PMI2_GASAC